MIPFFISAPRTRSSVLFETAQYYCESALNLLPLGNHTELFLEFSQNAEFKDAKTNTTHISELYPVLQQDNLNVHYVYPHIFANGKERNLYKLDILQQQKQKGINYNIKGTLQIADTPDEIIDFYKDRHFVITKRRNLEDYLCSFLVALTTKLFHARPNNVDRYQDILDNQVTVKSDMLDKTKKLLDYTKKLWSLERYITDLDYTCTVTYYEDLDTQDNIHSTLTKILGTDTWQQYLPENYQQKIPIKIQKDYSKVISNYDEIISVLRQNINQSGIKEYT